MDTDFMLIYDAIREKLGTDYENVFYQSMREDQPGDVGIYLYESSNDLMDLAGDDVYNCVKVQIQVNSEQSEDGMRKALNYLKRFTHRIESETSEIDEVDFISAQHLGPRAIAIGKNQYNILICRSVIDSKYTLETKK